MNPLDFCPFAVPAPAVHFVNKPTFAEGESNVWTIATLKDRLLTIANLYIMYSQAMEGGQWYEQRSAFATRDANLSDFLQTYNAVAHADRFRTLVITKYSLDLSYNALDRVVADVARQSHGALTIGDIEKMSLGDLIARLEATSEPAPQTSERDIVFIGYAHKDSQYLTDLLIHLKPLERAGKGDIQVVQWSDRQIAPGLQWFNEIKSALARTTVAVMMVTPDFLASDFIHQHELGPLLKEAEQGGVRILWIPVRPCSYNASLLSSYQSVGDPSKCLSEMRKPKRDRAWVQVCEEIKKVLSSSAS